MSASFMAPRGVFVLSSMRGGITRAISSALAASTFVVSKQVFLAFKNGDPYRVYYAPNSKRIVAAEWLRGEDNLLLDVDDFDEAA